MIRKTTLIALAASTVFGSACGTDGQLKIRPVGAQAVMPVSDLLAEARLNFGLGNVALALDQFRRASRLQPDNVDALNGMAACYDRMGRFDMSRLYYEKALAIAPNHPKTLHNFALSLNMQGRTREALALSREAAQALAAAASVATPATPGTSEEAPAPAPVSESLAAPAALAPPVPARTEEPHASAPGGSPAMPRAEAPAPEPSGPRLERVSLGEVALVTAPTAGPSRPSSSRRADRVVSAAPLKLVKQTRTSSEWEFSSAPPASPTKPAAPPAKRRQQEQERPAPAAVPPARTATRPVATAKAASTVQRSPRVQVLNAVGRKGLAGRYRGYLQARGWTELRAADARRPRTATIILYPAGARAHAAALARRLPFQPLLIANKQAGSELLLVLGSDALAFDNRLRRVTRA